MKKVEKKRDADNAEHLKQPVSKKVKVERENHIEENQMYEEKPARTRRDWSAKEKIYLCASIINLINGIENVIKKRKWKFR